MRHDVCNLLRKNPYPGRGMILGCGEDGLRAIVVYFIMGRSLNSRNRVFEKTEGGIRTSAHDPALMTDPSLVIYHPVRTFGGRAIVTNGDQTDTIYEFLSRGNDFRSALLSREFEPDAPNYTPRISGIVELDGSYSISILKTAEGEPQCCLRAFYEYSKPVPGLGHFISTYIGDGDPLPSFEGEPIPVNIAVDGGLAGFATAIWDALDDGNKVSLYARQTIIATGKSTDLIINKNI